MIYLTAGFGYGVHGVLRVCRSRAAFENSVNMWKDSLWEQNLLFEPGCLETIT